MDGGEGTDMHRYAHARASLSRLYIDAEDKEGRGRGELEVQCVRLDASSLFVTAIVEPYRFR